MQPISKLKTEDKVFHHVDHKIDIPELNAEMINGVRYYDTPNGKKYPSITSLLSKESREAIRQWRKRVGEEEANKITKKAANRGSLMHDVIEKYLYNKNLLEEYNRSDLHFFNKVKRHINKIDNIFALEIPVFCHDIELAGRADCIAEYDGVPSIIDFKTSRKPKKREWCKNYFMQASFYSLALQEMTGIKVSNLVLILSNENGTIDIFQDKRSNHLKDLYNIREKYRYELLYELN